jgi:phosphatidylglycerol:prolipoprotein diacylglycerol transferase
MWMRRRGARDRLVFGTYLLAAGGLRFLIELVRVNVVVALGMTTAQLFSVGLMVAGAVVVATRGADVPPPVPAPARRARRR